MNARWRAAIERGLGDRKTRWTGVLLIVAAAFTKLLIFRDYANFEMIFAASLIGGSVLGRWWTVLVPLGALAIVEPFLWGGPSAGYAGGVVLGITFFVVTGFVFVGLLGRVVKPRVVLRIRGLALLTGISIPLTILYDLWTDVGEYYFIAGPMGLTFWNVLELQVPFTIYHILSSFIFVPLLGMGIYYLHTVLWPSTSESAVTTPTDRPAPAEDR